MTIEMADKGMILVTLSRDDMREYRLNIEGEEQEVEQGLRSLLYRVGEVCGIDHRGKSYLIEALPAREGCLLIISVHAAKRRRVYRIKRSAACEVCVFRQADDMLDYLSRQPDCSGALYRYDGRYVLLPAAAISPSELRLLSEYADVQPVSAVLAARVREFGTLLRQRGVQRRHIGGRAVAVRDAASRHG